MECMCNDSTHRWSSRPSHCKGPMSAVLVLHSGIPRWPGDCKGPISAVLVLHSGIPRWPGDCKGPISAVLVLH